MTNCQICGNINTYYVTLCSTELECDPVRFFTCKTGACIPIGYMCDGKYDCGEDDDSDETHPNCTGLISMLKIFQVLDIKAANCCKLQQYEIETNLVFQTSLFSSVTVVWVIA